MRITLFIYFWVKYSFKYHLIITGCSVFKMTSINSFKEKKIALSAHTNRLIVESIHEDRNISLLFRDRLHRLGSTKPK